MKHNYFIYSAALILLVFVTMGTLQAQSTAYNNFGEGNNGWDYNWGLGWSVAGTNLTSQFYVEQAMDFESAVSGTVSDIWLAISYVPLSNLPDTVIIRLASNPFGLPPDSANVMEEWTLTQFGSWSQWNTPIHLTGNGNSLLEEGNSYWLWAYATEGTWTMWCMNEDPSFTCPHTLRHEGEDWFSISNETASAFRVDVSTGTGIASQQLAVENDQTLGQNFPNPFTGTTSIPFKLKNNSQVSLKFYNATGQLVKTLEKGHLSKGEYETAFDRTGLESGIYFYQLMATDDQGKVSVESKQMILGN